MDRPPAVTPPHCVAVIDDDPAVRSSLQFSLEVEGYEVETYDRPGPLLDQADLSHCGCLIVDYNLPGTDGLSALDALRNRGLAVPAILITTAPTAALRARAAAAGVPIVEKPLLGNTLLDAVRAAVARSLN